MSAPASDLGQDLQTGAHHYRAFVGPAGRYDLLSAIQFNLLTALGLREQHFLLDIGCGSCRAGRLFIPYLLPGHYFGIEPEQWLVEEGIAKELGRDVLHVKQPTFSHDVNFTLTCFNRRFDFLLAQSVFSHTSEAQLRRCLEQARQVMEPTAVFAANFKVGPRNYTGSEWVYPNCSTFTMEHFCEVVADEGLACVPLAWPHPALTWVAIVHPGQEKHLPDLGHAGACAAEKELAHYHERLARLEGHPYVKFGLRVHRLLRGLLGR